LSYIVTLMYIHSVNEIVGTAADEFIEPFNRFIGAEPGEAFVLLRLFDPHCEKYKHCQTFFRVRS
jgi:hypothetical protein